MAAFASFRSELRDGERQVRLFGIDFGLDDVVDDDLGLGKMREYLCRVAGFVVDADKSDFRKVFVNRCS